MIRIFFTSFLIAFQLISASCQFDTIFLDRKFNPIEKGKHSYYRIIDKMPSGKYRVLDYFKNGNIQMAGYSEKPDSKHFTGRVVRYNRDRKIESLCDHKEYDKGWITFYNSNNKKVFSAWCMNNKKNGKVYFYNKKGKVFAKGKFVNDKFYSGERPGGMALMMFNEHNIEEYKKGRLVKISKYYSNGKLAMRGSVGSDKYKLSSAVFYNPKGKKIGKCKYENGKPFYGKCLVFSDRIFFSSKPARVLYSETYVQGEVVSRESFNYKGKSIGKCLYQYNSPYDGKILKDNTLYTYANGKKEGEVIVYDNKIKRVIQKYFIHNGKKNGQTYYYDYKNTEYIGEFKDDKPYNNYVYSKRQLCNYKNGLKEGICYSYSKGKLLSEVTFKNDKKEGLEVYYGHKVVEKISGKNKKDKPFSGDFQNGYRNGKYYVQHYEEGIKVSQRVYFKDTFSLYSKEIFPENLIIYYNKNGEERFRGYTKNDKPYTGTFISNRKISTYLNGKLEGEAIYYNYLDKLEKIEYYKKGKLDGEAKYFKKGELERVCEYRDGKPYTGRFKDKRGNFLNYLNGKISGENKIRINNFTCLINYINGKKEGKSICWSRQSKIKKLKSFNFINMDSHSDTLFANGIYKNGFPYSGFFVKKSSIEEYKDGIKNGYTISFFRVNSGEIIAVEHYFNDKLDGKSEYFIGKKSYTSIFDNGSIVDGPLIDKKLIEDWKEDNFQYYKNYKKINKVLKYNINYCNIILLDEKPYDGYTRRKDNYQIFDEYNNGDLIYTYYITGLDTIWKTVYNGFSSETINKKNEIIYKTKYDEKYNNGIAEHFVNNKPISKIHFKNNKIILGCIDEDIDKNNVFGGYKSINICKDSNKLVVEIEYLNKRIKEEYIFNEDSGLNWPFIFNYGIIMNLLYNSGKYIVNYYDTESGAILAAFNSDKGLGIRINQNGNEFEVERYLKNETKSYNCSYDEMLIKIREWSKNSVDNKR